MRTGAAAGTTGYFHEAALYASDEEFIAIVVPFLRDGVAAGEPTLVTLAEANTALVRSALADTSGITFLPGGGRYLRPAAAIRSYRESLAAYRARGASQVRVVGDVPHPGSGAEWNGWARYEAAVNHAYDDFPLWGLCPYDTRTTPAGVLADVLATHPHLATGDGRHVANAGFDDPARFLARRTADPLPPEPEPPVLDLTDPLPGAARWAARHVAEGAALGVDATEDLVIAVSEAVSNALCHGLPPLRLRLWAGRSRVTAAVTDTGAGPTDPYVGLLPTTGSTGAGLGLWVTHQICTEVTLHRGSDGYTVRMVVAP